ncbi:MAG: SsrA-binding protein SmpB [Bdellovibrionota bacterium]
MSAKDKDKEKKNSPTILNKKAGHDYHILKKFEAGIELKGSEVKSCREGKVQLVDSYASFERGELFLHKAHISEFKQSGPYFNHLATRKRKLLLHRQELNKLENELKTSGQTLVPTKVYFVKGHVKVEIGLAKGKKAFDKRETIKKKDEKRRIDQAIKQRR